jgi:hypothetical protein
MNFGVHVCENVGIAGTTRVHTRKLQESGVIGDRAIPEIWEARVGMAIAGYAAPTTTEESNPFDRTFRDNFARGFGTSEDEAIAALRLDLKRTADGLWA